MGRSAGGLAERQPERRPRWHARGRACPNAAGGAKRGQPRPKRQNVTVEILACPIRVTYETNVRRSGGGETVTRSVWLVEVRLLDTKLEPWLLLTDWEVATEVQALRIFRMYRQRWGVEDC